MGKKYNKIIKFVSVLLSRDEFKEKPYKVIYRILYWQIISRIYSRVLYTWFAGLRVASEKSDTGFTGNIYYGLMERNEISFFISVVQKKDTFVDVGANVGVYTMLISKIINARCIALEPSTATFKKLKFNILLNKLQNVKLYKYAVGSFNTKVSFTKELGPENVIVNKILEDTETIEQRSLDYLIDEPVSFIKIDTEGNELAVLQGAKRIISSPNIMAIQCEINGKSENFGIADDHITSFFEFYGFEPFIFTKMGKLEKGVSTGSNKIFIKNNKVQEIKNRIIKNKNQLKQLEF